MAFHHVPDKHLVVNDQNAWNIFQGLAPTILHFYQRVYHARRGDLFPEKRAKVYLMVRQLAAPGECGKLPSGLTSNQIARNIMTSAKTVARRRTPIARSSAKTRKTKTENESESKSSVSPESKNATSREDAALTPAERGELKSALSVEATGATKTDRRNTMNMFVSSTALASGVAVPASDEISNPAATPLAVLIENLRVTKAAAEEACSAQSVAEDKHRRPDGGFARPTRPRVCGGISDPTTIIVGDKRTELPAKEWFFSNREEVEKHGKPEQLADWDRQEKANAKDYPREILKAERAAGKALKVWTAAEQAIVRYRPTSVAEAVELLTLAGRDPTIRSKGEPRLDIDEADYRAIVHNCSVVLQGAFANASAPTSPLEMIDETIQPISSDPDLKAELDRLTKEQNVGGLISLFDMYVAAAEAILLVQNQPRSGDTDFMEAECCHFWSKAYAVATRLRALRPTSYERERFVQTLFNCALHMGHNLEESVQVMNAALAVPVRADDA